MRESTLSKNGEIIKKEISDDSINIYVTDLIDVYYIELFVPKIKNIPYMPYNLSDVQAKINYKNNRSGAEIEHHIAII